MKTQELLQLNSDQQLDWIDQDIEEYEVLLYNDGYLGCSYPTEQTDLEEYENYVNTGVSAPINQDQFDAMVSWVYNLGNGNFSSSTMLKVLNAGDYDGVPEQIKRWNKAGGKVLEGLVKRRQSEANLFMGMEWKL